MMKQSRNAQVSTYPQTTTDTGLIYTHPWQGPRNNAHILHLTGKWQEPGEDVLAATLLAKPSASER